ncbi:MAG: pyruvate, phosphate dikinase [Hyphomicrobiales bacterium]|nr:pyruvate, phosphate dikinase [Hyphomicrobiales bacterium]
MQTVRIGNGPTQQVSAEIVGSKAANLARMAALGLPVPPAFVLPVELCAAIVAADPDAERHLAEGLRDGIAFLESVSGKQFGDRRRPLLVSVRSGAAQSMPGMLDTVLDVGCTAAAVRGLVRMTGNPRFAWDCRQRLLEGYAAIVLGIDPAPLTTRAREMMVEEGVDSDRELDGEALERLAADYAVVLGADAPPDDPVAQLTSAARAVYRSWMSERAQTYRRLQHLEHLQGTAVTVQAMVFGNCSSSSAAGVAFSRDPSTGAAQPVIEVLFEAQGEDVVAGRHTPQTEEALARALPTVAIGLRDILRQLEREFGDVQDIEFTIEDGRLYILQTRTAKRTPRAALRIAIDLVHEGLITPAQALRRLDGIELDALSRQRLLDTREPVARGIGASSGVACGRAAFDSDAAKQLTGCGDPVILVRPDTNTADVAGFAVSAGIVTAVGGRTAHAALVARQMGKPCGVGCDRTAVDIARRRAQFATATVAEGEWISIDGDSGKVYLGRREVVTERPEGELAEVERWRQSAMCDSRDVRLDAAGLSLT